MVLEPIFPQKYISLDIYGNQKTILEIHFWNLWKAFKVNYKAKRRQNESFWPLRAFKQS